MIVSRVCLVGTFPPPLHGMSLINEYVKNRVIASGIPVCVIDTSPRRLSNSPWIRIWKIVHIFRGILVFCLHSTISKRLPVYMGLSGGGGQVYDTLFVGIARLTGAKLFLHHHSYLYLNRVRRLTRLLLTIAGPKAVHIVSSNNMARDLQGLYPVVSEVRVISGIAAIDDWQEPIRQRSELRTLGFIGNISKEKGIVEFVEAAIWADRERPALRFLLAGPYHSNEARAFVESKAALTGNMRYVGAVYGDAKRRFFDEIDVFLFPSHNESDPLVMHEAMSRGVPVIAYYRGCIEQTISDKVGLGVQPSDAYVEKAKERILLWIDNPAAFRQVSEAATTQFRAARALHSSNMESLCGELVNPISRL